MAVYRFKVSFEDYDDVVREIDIKSNQTFEDLHKAVHQSTGYNPELSSSFYVCNDQWIKSDEIAYLPSQRKIDNGVISMINSKLSNYIDDPHQKFYYTYNFDRPFDFHVELIKIILNEEQGKTYPNLFRKIGEAPKIPVAGPIIPSAASLESDEFDFLNEIEDFVAEDDDSIDSISELPIAVEIDSHDEDEVEKDDLMDEFSDSDSYDADDLHKDDY
ncbi:MAG: hypothetical protein JWQ25_391 [Daejeonella sp.]|nr:hypothetical protein [Daejeonella sp.]